MSDSPNTDLDLNLHFLPDWAKGTSDSKEFKKYTGEEGLDRERPDRKDRRGPRPAGRGPQRGPGGSGPRDGGGSGRPPRRDGPRQGGGPQQRRGPQRGRGGPRRSEGPPLPNVEVSFMADDTGAETLARQIKSTGRAFPLFNIAQMVLGKPERHIVELKPSKEKGSEESQRLFVCALDDSIWLSESDAGNHALNKFFDTFYETMKTESEPPKGTYTFVARCGMSGRVLGPPNHHDYQNELRALYKERFERKMSFDAFKSRVEIVKDEESIQEWVTEQSFVTTYKCLNVPEEIVLESRQEAVDHFEKNHRPNVVKEVEQFKVGGKAASQAPCRDVGRLVRRTLEEQKRFPLKTVHRLSEQFASRGLQFFKADKAITYVAVARPRQLDLEGAQVSPGIREILEFIKTHPGCHRKTLIDTLAPADEEATEPRGEQPPADAAAGAAADSAESEGAPTQGDQTAEAAASEQTEPAKEASGSTAVELNSRQKAVIGDLHWLIHQGHVIEFASGVLQSADAVLSMRPKKKESKGNKDKQQGSKAQKGSKSGDKAAEPAAAAETTSPESQATDAGSTSGPEAKSSEGSGSAESSPIEAPGSENATAAEESVGASNPPGDTGESSVANEPAPAAEGAGPGAAGSNEGEAPRVANANEPGESNSSQPETHDVEASESAGAEPSGAASQSEESTSSGG